MTASSDSDRHALSKNGHEHLQDMEIRELRRELAQFRESEDEWQRENALVHTQLVRSVTRQSIIIGLAAAVFSGFVAWLGALWLKVDNVEERLVAQHAADQLRNDAHTFKGEQWGATMQRDIEINRKAIEDMQRRLFGRTNGQKNGE